MKVMWWDARPFASAPDEAGLIVCGPLRTLLPRKEMAFLLEPPHFAADDAYA